MGAREEQVELIDDELRRLERRIQELRHQREALQDIRADLGRCRICARLTTGGSLCPTCSAPERF